MLLWNISGFNQRPKTLFNVLRTCNPQFVLLTETHLRSKNKIDYQNYHVIQKGRSEASGASWGGVALLVKRGLKFKITPLEDLDLPLEMVAIKIHRPGQRNLILATLYLRSGDTNRHNRMSKVLRNQMVR